jgi:hypothetical protein
VDIEVSTPKAKKTVSGNRRKYCKNPRLIGLSINVKISHETNIVMNITGSCRRLPVIDCLPLSKISFVPRPNVKTRLNENTEKTASMIKLFISLPCAAGVRH